MMNDDKTHVCGVCGGPMPEGEKMFKFHGLSGPRPKPPLPQPPTLEDLLRMTVPVGPGCTSPEGTPMSPGFRVSVQKASDDGVHFIIHANGHDSETVDFVAKGNRLEPVR